MKPRKDMVKIRKTKSVLVKEITSLSCDFDTDHLFGLYISELENLLDLLRLKQDANS